MACERFVKLVLSTLSLDFAKLSSSVSGTLSALLRESLLDIILCEYVSGNGTSSKTLSIIRQGSVSKSRSSDEDSVLSSEIFSSPSFEN